MHGLRDLLSIQPFIILSFFIPFSLKVHTLYQFTAFLRQHPVSESLGDFSRSIYCLLYFAFFLSTLFSLPLTMAVLSNSLFSLFASFGSHPVLSKNKPCSDALNQQLSVWTRSFFQEYEYWIIYPLNRIRTWLCCILCFPFVPLWLCWS